MIDSTARNEFMGCFFNNAGTIILYPPIISISTTGICHGISLHTITPRARPEYREVRIRISYRGVRAVIAGCFPFVPS